MAFPATLIWKSSRQLWDITNGWQVENTYEGTATETELTDAVAELQTTGATRIEPAKEPYRVNELGEYSYQVTLRVTYAATGSDGQQADPEADNYGLFSRNWEVDFEEEQVPLMSADVVQPLETALAGWPAMVAAAADAFRRAWAEYAKSLADGQSPDQPDRNLFLGSCKFEGMSTDLNTLAGWLFTRLTANEAAADLVEHPILRKTEVVASYSNVKAQYENDGRIFTYTALVSNEVGLTGAALLQADDLGATHPYWLKRKPRVSLSSEGRFTITQEYRGLVAYDGVQWGPAIEV